MSIVHAFGGGILIGVRTARTRHDGVVTSLEKHGQDACAVALRTHGFVAKRRGILVQPGASKAVTGMLGLNLATWDLPSTLYINPVVGVRHVPVEEALHELAGYPRLMACVSRPLGYLTPSNTFVQWEFHAGKDLAAPAEGLASAVAANGQPFIDKWSDWSTFSSQLAKSGLLTDVEASIVLPIVIALNGDRDEADRLVKRELRRVGNKPDVYSRGYREFAAKFRAKDFSRTKV